MASFIWQNTWLFIASVFFILSFQISDRLTLVSLVGYSSQAWTSDFNIREFYFYQLWTSSRPWTNDGA